MMKYYNIIQKVWFLNISNRYYESDYFNSGVTFLIIRIFETTTSRVTSDKQQQQQQQQRETKRTKK